MSFDWTFPFGSYKGKTLEQVYKIDPQYLVWARDEIKDRSVNDAVSYFLQKKNWEIADRAKQAKEKLCNKPT